MMQGTNMKMEAVCLFETLVSAYATTQRHIVQEHLFLCSHESKLKLLRRKMMLAPDIVALFNFSPTDE